MTFGLITFILLSFITYSVQVIWVVLIEKGDKKNIEGLIRVIVVSIMWIILPPIYFTLQEKGFILWIIISGIISLPYTYLLHNEDWYYLRIIKIDDNLFPKFKFKTRKKSVKQLKNGISRAANFYSIYILGIILLILYYFISLLDITIIKYFQNNYWAILFLIIPIFIIWYYAEDI